MDLDSGKTRAVTPEGILGLLVSPDGKFVLVRDQLPTYLRSFRLRRFCWRDLTNERTRSLLTISRQTSIAKAADVSISAVAAAHNLSRIRLCGGETLHSSGVTLLAAPIDR
jgi:hypothetical protein